MIDDEGLPKILVCAQIASLRRHANDAETKWLTSSGWQHTSSTPGSYWLWMKEWDGKTFLVEQATAARIQETWDRQEDARLHPEKYED